MAVMIKDVAKQAGVSTATVSKVMNGSYSISQETIDRVKKVMQELDYHPNLRARNFVTQSTKTIVFVTSLGKNAGFANPHMFEMVCGMEHVLTEKGYSLVIKNMSSVEARIISTKQQKRRRQTAISFMRLLFLKNWMK